MFDAPVDAWYVWLGVAVVSLVVAGVAASLPTETGPDAASAADTVDRVAASTHQARAEHPIDADRVKIGPRRIALRDERGTDHATFAFGPAVPAPVAGPLRAVLNGAPPAQAFDDPADLRRAARDARRQPPTWQDAPARLRVRHVSWGGIDVTIVGVER